MPAMIDLFNVTRLAKPLTWEQGLRILERTGIARLGKTRMQSLAVGTATERLRMTRG
jgi:hypothetical protein